MKKKRKPAMVRDIDVLKKMCPQTRLDWTQEEILSAKTKLKALATAVQDSRYADFIKWRNLVDPTGKRSLIELVEEFYASGGESGATGGASWLRSDPL